MFVILHIAHGEDSATSEFWALERPGMILKYFFLNTSHLQPFTSSNGKRIFEKNQKTFRNVLDLGLVAYFSSTLYLSTGFVDIYTASKKHEFTLLHKYVLNEFLTADRSCTTKIF